MIKNCCLTSIFILLITANIFAQVADYEWAKSYGESKDDGGSSLCIDPEGNLITYGSFSSSTISFGSTTLTHSSVLNGTDIFITKTDISGNLVWAISSSRSSAYSDVIKTDQQGNIYISGAFYQDTISIGGKKLGRSTTDFAEAFVFKLTPDGLALWAKHIPGFLNNLDVDPFGNLLLVGTYGPSITFGSTLLSSVAGSEDVYVVKFDNNGNVKKAFSIGGNGEDRAQGIATDNDGNILLAGYFYSSVLTVGPQSFSNNGIVNIFVAKFDSAGNYSFARSFGGQSQDIARRIAADSVGNIYFTGRYTSSSLAIGTTTLTNIGNSDVFATKLNATGNILWTVSGGGSGNETAGLVADKHGNSFLYGYTYSGSLNFAGTTTFTGDGNQDFFIAKINSSGQVSWVKAGGGNNVEELSGATVDQSGNLVVIGFYMSSSLILGNHSLTNNGQSDVLLFSIGSAPTQISKTKYQEFFSVAPNPFTDYSTIKFQKDQAGAMLVVRDRVGKTISQQIVSGSSFLLRKDGLPAGLYYLQLIGKQGESHCSRIVVE